MDGASPLDLEVAIKSARMAMWTYDRVARDILRTPELNALIALAPDDRPTFEQLEARLLPGEGERIRASIRKALASPDPFFRTDIRFRRFDGEVRWFLLRAEVKVGEDGSFQKVVGMMIDLTERKLEEQENAYLASVVASTPYAVTSIDRTGSIKSWNDAAARVFGFTKDEAIGRNFDAIVPPDERERTWAGIRRALAGEVNSAESARMRKDETRFPAKVTWAPVRGPDDTVIGVSALIEDLTEAKRLEQRQSLLVRELHHRVRNTLATVQGIAGVTARVSDTVEEFRESFSRRIAALSQTHTRLTEAGRQTVSITDLIDQELGPFVSQDRIVLVGPLVELSSQVAPTLAMAIHELATNAVKHGSLRDSKGTIHISWSVEDRVLDLTWAEHGTEPPARSTRRGFGSTLLDVVLPAQFGSKVERTFEVDGIRVAIVIPLD